MNLLYIDPGTGSMLFAILLGAFTTLYFIGKNVFIRLKTLVLGGSAVKHEKLMSLVIYSEGGKYWLVFKPIVEELEARGIEASFLTSDKNDPGLNRPEGSSVKANYIGSGNMAWARLNMLEADTVLMTTPGLDVLQLKRSKKVRRYIHILHAVDDATSYRLFGLDYYDAVMLTGSHQEGPIRQLEELRNIGRKDLPVIGSTYLDEYVLKLPGIKAGIKEDGLKTVLVAPSWGSNGILSRYGLELLLPLGKSAYKIIIRPHPQSFESEAKVLEALKNSLDQYENISWDASHENLKALAQADVLISDFSGIVFDYAFLFGGPILYANSDFDQRPYDAGDLEEEPWKFQAIRELGMELMPEEFEKLPEIIKTLLNDNSRKIRVEEIKNIAWHNQGHAGKLAVDYILVGMDKAGESES